MAYNHYRSHSVPRQPRSRSYSPPHQRRSRSYSAHRYSKRSSHRYNEDYSEPRRPKEKHRSALSSFISSLVAGGVLELAFSRSNPFVSLLGAIIGALGANFGRKRNS
jgi:hypothetical protein